MAEKPEHPPLLWLFADRNRRRDAWNFWIRDTATGLLSVALQFPLRFLPIGVASELGAVLSPFIGRVTGSFLIPGAAARATWMRLRPDARSTADADAAIGRARRQVGRVMAEYGALHRLWRAGRIAVSGAEHLQAASDARKPVIVVGVHLGNWEAIGPALVGLGYKVFGFYEPPPNRFDHAFVVAARRRWRVDLIYPDVGGTRRAHRSLRAREGTLLMYIDEIFGDRVNAPAFGRALPTDGNIVRVARWAAMTEATVIPAYIERRDGANFVLHVQPAVDLVRTADPGADLAANVARLDAIIEPIVRRQLEQWYFLPRLSFDDPDPSDA